MAKYHVEVKEQWVQNIVVDAKNKEEAIDKAKEVADNVREPTPWNGTFSNYIGSVGWEVFKVGKKKLAQ